jgi:hypothetical protein
MRTPILCLKIRQMRAKLGGDAVQHEKSRAVMIGNVCRAIAGGRRFSANCFTPPFERERRLGYKSFICVRHGVMMCTLFVAVRLLLRPGATLPRPPLFVAPSAPVTESVPSIFFGLANC